MRPRPLLLFISVGLTVLPLAVGLVHAVSGDNGSERLGVERSAAPSRAARVTLPVPSTTTPAPPPPPPAPPAPPSPPLKLVPTVRAAQATAAVPARASASAPAPAPAPGSPRDPNAWARPCDGPVISPYGYRSGRRHDGMDVKCPDRGPVAAPLAGRVTQAGPGLRGYGNTVTIDYGEGMTSLLAHLSVVETAVGQWVTQGQLVGRIGMTGNASTPHLHYEVRDHGRPVDPAPYYR